MRRGTRELSGNRPILDRTWYRFDQRQSVEYPAHHADRSASRAGVQVRCCKLTPRAAGPGRDWLLRHRFWLFSCTRSDFRASYMSSFSKHPEANDARLPALVPSAQRVPTSCVRLLVGRIVEHSVSSGINLSSAETPMHTPRLLIQIPRSLASNFVPNSSSRIHRQCPAARRDAVCE